MPHPSGIPNRRPPSTPDDMKAGLVIKPFRDIKNIPIDWLWPNRIPLGCLTLFAGEQGVGKSFLLADVATRLSRGWPWPDRRDVEIERAGTLIFTAEDDPNRTIGPRLETLGADMDMVFYAEGVREFDYDPYLQLLNIQAHLPALDERLKAHPSIKLLALDPITDYTKVKDDNDNREVRAALTPLQTFARTRHISIVIIQHTNKVKHATGLGRVSGASAFTQVPRMNFLAKKIGHGRRVLEPLKCNLVEDPPTLVYGFAGGQFGWEPEPYNAPDAPESTPRGRSSTHSSGSAIERAKTLLQETLRDKSVSLDDIREAALTANLGWRTVERAKKSLGIESMQKPVKTGGTESWWYLNGR